MDQLEIKNRIKRLWKKTFNDSSDYVDLIFNNYYDEKYVAFQSENEEIVSALIGIPYMFSVGDNSIKGLYLCGLATQPNYRNKGIMTRLINEINKKAKEEKFAFTFLIPASDSLINYYSKHEYEKSMYRIEDRFTGVHDFRNDYISSIGDKEKKAYNLKLKYYDNLTCINYREAGQEFLHSIIEYIQKSEQCTHEYATLIHNENDIKNVISENDISNGQIIFSLTRENEISGVAFCENIDSHRVKVNHIYTTDKASYYKILEHIKTQSKGCSISVYKYPEETHRKALIGKVYGAENPDGAQLDGQYGITERIYNVSTHAKPYGMLRCLDLHEIIKFLAKWKGNLEFSILVKGSEKEPPVNIRVKKSNVIYSEITQTEFENESRHSGATVLSKRELLEILLRKPDSSNMIMEAFAIPRLILNISLLLD